MTSNWHVGAIVQTNQLCLIGTDIKTLNKTLNWYRHVLLCNSIRWLCFVLIGYILWFVEFHYLLFVLSYSYFYRISYHVFQLFIICFVLYQVVLSPLTFIGFADIKPVVRTFGLSFCAWFVSFRIESSGQSMLFSGPNVSSWCFNGVFLSSVKSLVVCWTECCLVVLWTECCLFFYCRWHVISCLTYKFAY